MSNWFRMGIAPLAAIGPIIVASVTVALALATPAYYASASPDDKPQWERTVTIGDLKCTYGIDHDWGNGYSNCESTGGPNANMTRWILRVDCNWDPNGLIVSNTGPGYASRGCWQHVNNVHVEEDH